MNRAAHFLIGVIDQPDRRGPRSPSQLRIQRVLVGKAKRYRSLRPLHHPVGGLGNSVVVHNAKAEARAQLQEVPRADAVDGVVLLAPESLGGIIQDETLVDLGIARSEEHTSELQSR